ncbi:hypothetical protein ElyMa_001080100 [Elysia marginata]|uniref:Uncharacterized protein n=1 Tax=Elysia marginata TaxID=1093978 RepID=A0AAV4HSB0_9GAST|nr:hypothetical protein ElyMa_001080100 [Elysia marginata]
MRKDSNVRSGSKQSTTMTLTEEEAGTPYSVDISGIEVLFYEIYSEPGTEYTFSSPTPFATYTVESDTPVTSKRAEEMFAKSRFEGLNANLPRRDSKHGPPRHISECLPLGHDSTLYVSTDYAESNGETLHIDSQDMFIYKIATTFHETLPP